MQGVSQWRVRRDQSGTCRDCVRDEEAQPILAVQVVQNAQDAEDWHCGVLAAAGAAVEAISDTNASAI